MDCSMLTAVATTDLRFDGAWLGLFRDPGLINSSAQKRRTRGPGWGDRVPSPVINKILSCGALPFVDAGTRRLCKS
jgi:hypothetical protein